MVQGVLEFVVTSVAAALILLFALVGVLAVLRNGDQSETPLQSLLSSTVLSWISLFWLLGISRFLVHMISGGGILDALPFILFLSPGLVYPWWMALHSARRSGPGCISESKLGSGHSGKK